MIFSIFFWRIYTFFIEGNYLICYPTMWEVSQLWENKK